MSAELGKYKPYSEYKYSGIEWVGNIPIDWDMWKLTHAYEKIGSGTTPPTAEEKWLEGNIPWVTTGELREDIINETSKCVSEEALLSFSALTKYPTGSVLIAMYGATIGRLGILGIEATTNQACCVMTKSAYINNRYLFYWLQAFRNDIINLSSGGGQPNINQEKVASLKVSAPLMEQQDQIALFLDYETARIDRLIAKQQQLIELLKEKRQAVISHVVTKGLNPDVPMKDSGVEWLGQVPEHWVVTSIRNIVRSGNLEIQDGNHGELHPTANEYVDEGIPFLMANNIRDGVVDIENCKKITQNRADALRIGFAKAGDMLLTHKGTVGEVSIIPMNINEPYWMLTPQVTYYRWDAKKFSSQYFMFQFQSKSIATQLDIIAGKQSTRAYIGLIAQGDLIIVVPPKNEQEELKNKLLSYINKMNKVTRKSEYFIQLLIQRRISLIYSAVTGKIDLRNWEIKKDIL